MTTLADITDALTAAGLLVQAAQTSPVLTGVTDDSRRATGGTLFCAVRGSTTDGHRFLEDAVVRGAAAALVAAPVPVAVPQVVVSDTRRAVAIAAARWHGHPAATMRLIGVTGTNGKSTTVALLRHLLNEFGDVGSIGTLGAFDGAGASVAPDQVLTTPGAVELHAAFRALRDRGVTTAVMEVSSHALDQQRLTGLTFRAGVFTNLTHDHLDYHGEFDAYLAAKLSLADLVGDGGALVTNADDPAWNAVRAAAGRRMATFGRWTQADVRATHAHLDATGADLEIAFPEGRVATRLPLLGEFNVSNALGAAATAWTLGLAPDRIAARLATAPQVSGRMERVAGDGFVVLRDYAHTPDALERVIRTLRPITKGRLLVLFGCGGDRDRRKRPIMGRIAARGADVAIVTSDNPRTEDPERIIDEIEGGMEGVAHLRITDRREAIARGVALLQPGDCLVLAGKGHETYQVVGTTRLPLDEQAIVREALAARGASPAAPRRLPHARP
jgi:UDP-N-acetylmuramoyl-L-alanyl-D-glutamate--2,6-diaminopimelate ligase